MPYVSEEAVADPQRVVAAALELSQEVLAVEVVEFLQVPKNDAALPTQVLGEVEALHLREVTIDDVAKRPHVFPLCGYHLINDVPQLAAIGNSLEGTQTAAGLQQSERLQSSGLSLQKFSLRPNTEMRGPLSTIQAQVHNCP